MVNVSDMVEVDGDEVDKGETSQWVEEGGKVIGVRVEVQGRWMESS